MYPLLLTFLPLASAFPFMGTDSITNSSEELKLALRQNLGQPDVQNSQCPFNSHHIPAVPLTKEYPYLGAQGTPVIGTGKGGIQVPAEGDEDPKFIAPEHVSSFRFPKDIGGPCPGILNALANHGFIARDGLTTFDELVAAQQSFFNLGRDVSVALAVFGVELDGDTITEKLSIGCTATPRTPLPRNQA